MGMRDARGVCTHPQHGAGQVTVMQVGALPTSHLLHRLTFSSAGARWPTGTHLKPLLAAIVQSKGSPRVCWKDAACHCVLRNGRNPTQSFPRPIFLVLRYCFVKLLLLVVAALPGCQEFPQGPV